MPLNRETEVEHLNLAETHIATAEQQITMQTAIVERLRADGRDTKEADRMLTSFYDILRTMHAHRELILSAIRDIDDGQT